MLLAQGRVIVDGEIVRVNNFIVDKFSVISVDGKLLKHQKPIYVMLNKPKGVVCATKDKQHTTVIDLPSVTDNFPQKDELHIAGRLDLNSTGLVLLTNDSRWSERLTLPETKVVKYYQVTLQNKLSIDYIDAFAQGMYFPFENITTKPAKLTIVSDFGAQVELQEGRYHQIKRMFGRFRNPVQALHRFRIGRLRLDESLVEGQSRELSKDEVLTIFD